MRFVLLLMLAACSLTCSAVKMQPGTKQVRQSDGTTLTVKAYGNHDFNYFTTVDGVLLCQVGKDFHIAKIDDRGQLRSTGVLAHESGRRGTVEQRLIESQDLALFEENMRVNANRAKEQREPLMPNSTLLPHQGNPRIPVILVEFSDTTFSVANPKNVFDKYLNGTELFNSTDDPDMGMNYGSVKHYFTDMSFGMFTPEFDVYGPVRLKQPLKYYGAGSSSSEKMNDLFRDACTMVDNDVDFSQYDSNDDGYVDLIYIIYAGYSESIIGNSTECIYPKSGTLADGITFDGKSLCRYGVNNELNGTPEDQASMGILINGIGLFCHEFSHCLGLPDMYPAPGSVAERCINQNLDYWDLMDAGEYTYNGYRPTEYTAWERERFGWLTIDTLSSACDVTLSPLSEGGKAYRILNDKDASGREYYIVENVQKTGWNRSLLGHGMLVYHVDYDEYSFTVGGCRVNNVAGHPRMTIIAADGIFMPEYFTYSIIREGTTSAEKEANAALVEKYGGMEITPSIYKSEQSGDPFPGTSGVVALTDDTAPSSAWVYTGGYMGKPITDIAENTDTKTISFKFMGGSDTAIKSVDNEPKTMPIYSLDGRYLGTDASKLNKGIYIVGNKKIAL